MEVSTMAVQLTRSKKVIVKLQPNKMNSIWTSKNTSKYLKCSTRKIPERYISMKYMI
jgi:hypothetical protein